MTTRRLSTFVAFLVFAAALAVPSQAQEEKDVAFVHGLFGDEGSWADTRSVFEREFEVRTFNRAYDSKASIDQIAAGYADGIPDGTIFVGHSMGGLVSRSVYRQTGGDQVPALVTLGTPHTGAPLAQNADRVDDVTSDWIDDLAAGPSYQYGGIIGGTLAEIASSFIEKAIDFIETLVTGGYDSIQDLRPDSEFIGDLGATRPPVTYAIWSKEQPNALWRLADARFSDSGVETGSGIQVKEDAVAYYSMMFGTAQSNAESYYEDYQDAAWWNLAAKSYYWSLYSYWSSVAAGYYDGLQVLTVDIDREWETEIVGVGPTDDSGIGYVREPSDGVVPYSSQAPGFIGPEFRFSARGVNHLEQTNNAETRSRLRQALRQLGVERE
jgi:pimeloyl-ACP methyl ester carboxylesterase